MNEVQSRRYAKLQIDYTDLLNVASRSDFIKIEAVDVEPGWPPEKYVVTFTCTGLIGVQENGKPVAADFHQFSLYLSRGYPGQEPSLLWLTDIWHPNIGHKEPRHVCTNAVQTYFSQKPLSELVASLGEMVQYKRYHALNEAPFPIDPDAARWVREIAEPNGWIGKDNPVDRRPLLREYKIARSNPSLTRPAEIAVVQPSGEMSTEALKHAGARIKLGSPAAQESVVERATPKRPISLGKVRGSSDS